MRYRTEHEVPCAQPALRMTGNGARKRTQALLFTFVAGAMIVGAHSARATVIEFEATGTSGGNPVDGTATITTSINSVTMVLEAAPLP